MRGILLLTENFTQPIFEIFQSVLKVTFLLLTSRAASIPFRYAYIREEGKEGLYWMENCVSPIFGFLFGRDTVTNFFYVH